MKQLNGFLLLGITSVMLFTLTGCGKVTVDLNKYVTITSEGYDSLGKASDEFDYDAFEKDYAGKIKFSKVKDEDISDLLDDDFSDLDDEDITELLYDLCIDESLDKASNLSNGDVVRLEWECEDALAEKIFNVKLVHSNISYTVEDLKDVDTFNPFDYVTVTFSGVAPNGTVHINADKNQKMMDYISLSANKTASLNVGDTVTVTASVSGDVTSFVDRFGCVPGETEKSYTCDALDSYVQNINDIPENVMNDMFISTGSATYEYERVSKWDNPDNLISISYVGNYFLKLKDGKSGDADNYLYLIYEVQSKDPDSDHIVDYYFYYRINDVTITTNGSYTYDLFNCYLTDGDVWTGDDCFIFGNYYYIGFDSINSLADKYILPMLDNYDCTTTLELDSYIQNTNDIPEDIMNDMFISEGASKYECEKVSQWNNPDDLISISYVGYYFLKLKDGKSGDADNYLYLIYEVLSKYPNSDQIVDYYFYYRINDVRITANGNYSCDWNNCALTEGDAWTGDDRVVIGNYYYIGFDSINSLADKYILPMMDNYDCTTTIE